MIVVIVFIFWINDYAFIWNNGECLEVTTQIGLIFAVIVGGKFFNVEADSATGTHNFFERGQTFNFPETASGHLSLCFAGYPLQFVAGTQPFFNPACYNVNIQTGFTLNRTFPYSKNSPAFLC